MALSNVDQCVRDKIRETDPGKQVIYNDYQEWIPLQYKKAIKNIEHLLYVAGEPSTVIRSLPRSSLIVLITARKVATRASLFNFEAVY